MSSLFANPFAVEEHAFTTGLTPAQCRQRLAASLFDWDDLDRWSFDNPRLKHPVVGEVTPQGFTVRKYARYRRPEDVQVWGTFGPTPTGSEVHVYLANRRRTAVFFALWFGFFLTLQLGMLLGLIGEPYEPGAFPGVWWPSMLLLIGGVAYLLGRSAARRDAVFLLDFVRQALQAREGPSGSAE